MSSDTPKLTEELKRLQDDAAHTRKTGTGVSVTAEPAPIGSPQSDHLSFVGGPTGAAEFEKKRRAVSEETEKSKKEAAQKAYGKKLWKYINWDPKFVNELSKHHPMTFSSFKREHTYFRNWYNTYPGEPTKKAITISEGLRLRAPIGGGVVDSIISTLFGGVLNEKKAEIIFEKDGTISVNAGLKRGFLKEKGTVVAVACARTIVQQELNMFVSEQLAKEQTELEENLQKSRAAAGQPPLTADELKQEMEMKFTPEYMETRKKEIIDNIPEAAKKEILTFEIDHVNNAQELGEMLFEMQNKQPTLYAQLNLKPEVMKKVMDGKDNLPEQFSNAINKQLEIEEQRKKTKKSGPEEENSLKAREGSPPKPTSSSENSTPTVTTRRPHGP